MDAWGSGERIAKARDERDDRAKIDAIEAKTLSNRNPPWGIVGGLFDCLQASGGEVLAVSNAELRAAQALFRDLEGCDISPEAGVAAASLLKKAMAGEIESDAIVMLNVTGGGYESLRSDPRATRLRPDLVLRKDEFEPNRFLDSIAR